MSPRDVSLSGLEAAQRVLAEAEHEEFVSLDLVARALRTSRRRLIREWDTKGWPTTRVGRTTWLSSKLVLARYFPHRSAAFSGHSAPDRVRYGRG